MARLPVKLEPSSNDLKRLGNELKKAASALAAANKTFGAGVTKKTAAEVKSALSEVKGELDGLQKMMSGMEKSLSEFQKVLQARDKQEKDVKERMEEVEGLSNVEDVLKSDYATDFRDFCKKEHSLENLDFLEAIENGNTPLSIYKKFVQKEDINLPAPEQKALVAKYEPLLEGTPSRDRPSLADFNDAKETISKLLNRDTLRRFKKEMEEKMKGEISTRARR